MEKPFPAILTVDVEDWFHTTDFNIDPEEWYKYESRIERNTYKILDILDRYSIKGTFFVLGEIAHKHPKLIKKIFESGHEIGSHSTYHETITDFDPDSFKEDLKKSCGYIEDITGEKVLCYRSPSWSIDRENIRALEILEEEGILFDSSIQPFKTFLSGDGSFPITPFHPVIDGRRLNLLEVPSTVRKICGIRVPFSGGTYFRVMPLFFTIESFKKVSRRQNPMFYVHPWEIDPDQPRISADTLLKLLHYRKLDKMEDKICKLFDEISFSSLMSTMEGYEFPEFVLD